MNSNYTPPTLETLLMIKAIPKEKQQLERRVYQLETENELLRAERDQLLVERENQ